VVEHAALLARLFWVPRLCLSWLPDEQARNCIKVVSIGDKAGEPETFHNGHGHSIIRQQAVLPGEVRGTFQEIERHWFDMA